jgi:uncharacterized protein
MTEQSIGRHAIFVDSSAFFAAASARDADHARARSVHARVVAEGWRLVTTTYVVAELHALTLARLGPRRALVLIERIVQSNAVVVRVIEDDWKDAFRILRRFDDKDFSFTDALSFAVMDRLGVREAFTFDRHFAQYGFQLVGN